MTTQRSILTLLSLSLGLAAIAGCDVDSASTDLDVERDLDEQAEDSEGDLDEAPLDQDRPDELAIDVDDDATASTPINLALGKPTTQSTTYAGGDAGRAVDGNTDGNWFNGSVNHTNLGPAGWWQVDLQSVEPVGEVVIYNRTDCCALLQDFDVLVSADGVIWSSFRVSGVAGDETHVAIERMARYVKIANPTTLHMAEVEVLRSQNLALGRPATQSSTAFGGDAARAVDGNTDGNYWSNSVSHTDYGAGQWWQVDLESVQRIREVVVHNRTDCCDDKLRNFRLSTSPDGITWTTNMSPFAANPGIAFSLDLDARYVRITNGNDYLHMAEVQVFGDAVSNPVQYWGEFQAGSCVDTAHRKFSAILWDIPAGASWEDTCAATPARVVHDTFVRPTACVNTGLNMWGEFHVRDGSCDVMPPPAPLPPASDPVLGLSPSTPFSVVLASDPQLYWSMVNTESPNVPEYWGSRDEVEVTARSHTQAMRRLAEGHQLPAGTTRPEAVIMNGDLTNFSRYDEYDAYYRLYDEVELGMPRFDGLGNHDYGDNVVGDCAATWWEDILMYHATEGWNFCALDAARRMRAWITNNGEVVDWDYDSMAYAFVRNNVRFLQLQNYPGYAEPEIGIDTSYAWINEQMQAAQAQGQYVVLNMHIVSGAEPGFQNAVAGYEHLLLAIFGGHLHDREGQDGSVNVNGTSVPVAYGGSQQYNHFTLVQFDLDKVTFRAIDSRDGNATVIPGSVVEIPYPQQDIGAPLLDIPLAAGSLVDHASGRAVIVSGTSLAADHRGRSDGARQFDGVADVITIDASAWAGNDANTFTLAGWLDWDDTGTDQIGFLFGGDFERMEVHTGGGAGVNGLRFIPAGYGPSHVDASGVLAPGWNHIAVTYTGTVATIYVNGQEVATRSDIGAPGNPAPIDLSTNSGGLRVGMRENGSLPLAGRVDGIAFYGQALSKADIVKLMLR